MQQNMSTSFAPPPRNANGMKHPIPYPSSSSSPYYMQQQTSDVHSQEAPSASAYSTTTRKGEDTAVTTSGTSSSSAATNSTRLRVPVLSLIRTLLLDMPLALLFLLLLMVLIMKHVHQDIFMPFLQAAARTDDDLYQEFTYYDRACTALDVTTRNAQDLIVRSLPNNTMSTTSTTTSSPMDSTMNSNTLTAPQQAVDTFMTHGAVVLPQILPPDTVAKLRAHVVDRNLHLSDIEAIPVSQGKQRKSFAFDAAEAPIVSLAVQHVASHPLLRPILQQLVGDDDPAVSEITAITAYPGCPDQTWHQDVKADGSPLKFARTYTHSHSLFIPLQDTTTAMGATSLCPGTHYCANEGMADVCQEYGMQLGTGTRTVASNTTSQQEQVWKSGDGALLSQHVWHRGAKHTDPNAPERIVVVMTFLARPNLTKDRRQLSRGTYFHMRWNMWGHTFRDLKDAAFSMAKPFSVLRCTGLWKPATRNWGYDLMTSGLLRCANNQMGMTYEELEIFVDTVITRLKIPNWLQGPVTEEDDAWQIYLHETLDKSLDFMMKLNAFVLGPYLLLVTILACMRRKSNALARSIVRLGVTHGTLLLLAHCVWNRIDQSQFAVDLHANRLLMRAFPVAEESEIPEMKDDQALAGPTALPERDDVLLGSRFDARFLGAFDRWLDYHPGNKAFRKAVAENAEYYQNYSSLPDVFGNQVVNSIISLAARRGRYLSQDYRHGLWIVMPHDEVQKYVRQSVLATSSGLLGDLDQEISYMLADYRFGLKRGTSLAKCSRDYLLYWRNDVLFPRTSSSDVDAALTKPLLFLDERPLPKLESRALSTVVMPMSPSHERWSDIPSPPPLLEVGDLIEVKEDGNWYRGSIVEQTLDGMWSVSFEDGETVHLSPSIDYDIRPVVPLEEGSRLLVKLGKNKWLEGTVVFVHPSREIDVVFEERDYSESVPYWRYKVLAPVDE